MTNASALDELAAKFDALPADKLRELDDQLTQAHGDKVWYPNPGPQTAGSTGFLWAVGAVESCT